MKKNIKYMTIGFGIGLLVTNIVACSPAKEEVSIDTAVTVANESSNTTEKQESQESDDKALRSSQENTETTTATTEHTYTKGASTQVATTSPKSQKRILTSDDVKNYFNDILEDSDVSKKYDEATLDLLRKVVLVDKWYVKELKENQYGVKSYDAGYTFGFKVEGNMLEVSNSVLESVFCSACNGQGYIVNEGINCSTCGGAGQIYVPNVYYDVNMGWQGQWQTCSACGGVGKLNSTTEHCQKCRGYGYAF